ncbi:MAG: CPBP family intramembrane metalloprotease [Lachnospiraceae bacterium]|nr:CPBP family intramembrane metalloprotease [Lachnospiraceae bacterium]
MKDKLQNVETKRILIYVVSTFLLTWIYCIAVIYPMMNGETLSGVPAVMTQFLVAAAMFVPAIGVLVTRLVTKEGLKNAWVRPNLKGNIKTYLLAYFGPAVLTILGAVFYFVIFQGTFDPECGYMGLTLEAAGTPAETIPVPLSTLMLIQAVQAIFLGPILNFVTCFGEEWGWRGYLVPKLSEKFSTIPMLLISGLIWGLWHAPLTIVGHNYGVGYAGFPFTGILAMCLFCIVMGVFLSYVTLKTKSCIPAVLGHGAINGFAAIGMYFTKDGGNPFVGPAPTGVVGMIPFVIAAVVMIIKLKEE